MEIYAEFKPCYLTKYLTKYGFDKEPIIYESKAHFVDGECKLWYGSLFISNDLKYVYCYYRGEPSYYRVTNVSSKPILYEVDKVKKWYEITKEINKLKEQRKKLMYKNEDLKASKV